MTIIHDIKKTLVILEKSLVVIFLLKKNRGTRNTPDFSIYFKYRSLSEAQMKDSNGTNKNRVYRKKIYFSKVFKFEKNLLLTLYTDSRTQMNKLIETKFILPNGKLKTENIKKIKLRSLTNFLLFMKCYFLNTI